MRDGHDSGLLTLRDVAGPDPNSFVDSPFGSNLRSTEYSEFGVRLVQLQNIGDGYWINDNQKYISAAKFRALRRHGALPGDIAIAKMADPVARACLLPKVAEQFLVVADCMKLTPDSKRFDPRYLVHAINSHHTRREAERKSTGTTRLRINLSVLKTVHIWAPSLGEQRLIAEILDTLDEAIRKTEQIIAKLKQIKEGLLHDLLTRGIDENGELRDPEQHPEQFKDSPLGRIPEAWQALKLGEITTWLSGGTPSKALPAFWGGRIPWVSPKDIKVFRIGSAQDTVTEAGIAAGSRIAPEKSVLLVVRGMILAHTFPVCLTTKPVAFNQDVKAVMPRPDVDSRYLGHWFVGNSQRMLGLVTDATHGTKRIDLNDLKGFKLALPPIAEQQCIANILDAHGECVYREKQNAEKLHTLKQGLMDDLLTGRVRVTPLLEKTSEAVA